MSKSTTNAIVAFFAGASVSVITGILFAPDKGTKTRKKINKKAKKVSAEVKDRFSKIVFYCDHMRWKYSFTSLL